ncbi:hypothetical protein, partial [Ignavibacterium album]
MKKSLILFLVVISGLISAQNINGRFSSSLYSFERFDSADVSQNHLRAYQMLNLNLNYGDVSIRSYLNFENDFAQDIKNDPRLRFYNLYLEARNILNVGTLKLGRQPIINSVVGGLMDGVSLSLKKADFQLSGFYGGNVPAYQKLELIENFSDNYIAGGKLSTTIINNLRLGIGYLNKNFKPLDYKAIRLDPDLNPIEVLIQNKSNQYQFITGEAAYYLPQKFSVDINYEYDLNFKETSKFEFDGRYEEIKDFGLNFYYSLREPKIRYNSIFSVFDYGNTEEIELGSDIRINENFTVLGQFGIVNYRDDNSSRVGIGLATSIGTFNYKKTFGYAGQLEAISAYSAYTLAEGLITPSAGFSYTTYKLS